MGKSYRNSASKASRRALFFFVKTPKQPFDTRNSLKNKFFKIYFERGLSKSLKKVNFIFSFEPIPF